MAFQHPRLYMVFIGKHYWFWALHEFLLCSLFQNEIMWWETEVIAMFKDERTKWIGCCFGEKQAKHTKSREWNKQSTGLFQNPSSSRSITPTSPPSTLLAPKLLLTAAVDDQLESDYKLLVPSDIHVHPLQGNSMLKVLVDKALLAWIQLLEAELKKKLKEATAKSQHF